MPNTKAWWIGGAAALTAVAVAAAVLAASQRTARTEPPPPTLEFTAQEVVTPMLATMASQVRFSGPLVAPQTATVRARTIGTLMTLTVAEGSRVRAGQVLATIDPTESGMRIEERAALLESARAALSQAERTHANNQRLADQQFISPTALDQSRAALDAARAQERAARAQLETARALSRDTRVVAPIDGIVARRHAVAGEKVSTDQNIVTIVDLGRLELAGAVGTHEVALLSAGMPVAIAVEGVAEPVRGQIARIAPSAEPGTRSIGVTIELPNAKETLRAGQYALATVNLPDPQPRLTVPLTAVGSTNGQDHVWLIENGVLARRAVTLGRRDGREGRVEVLAGVPPGSQVLAARFDSLREGGSARVVARSAPPVAAAASSAPQVR